MCVCAQDESRWEREITRLQATAAADLGRIRQEATEAAEREARLLRCVWVLTVAGLAPLQAQPVLDTLHGLQS